MLEQKGVRLDRLPEKELENGVSEVIQAYCKWNNYLDYQERLGRAEPQGSPLLNSEVAI
jgi:hypothetical protein